MKRFCLSILLAFSAIGCATSSPWPSYESALRCHFDGKKNECDKEYQNAIKIDPKTQGLHASYGTHLLLTGRMQEAEKEFALEKQNYPNFSPIGISRLYAKDSMASTVTAPNEPPPVPATAPTGAPPSLVTPDKKGVGQ